MRLTSLIAAGLVATGLAYWFVVRHAGDETVASAVVETPSAEVADARPVPVQVIESKSQPAGIRLIVRGRTNANRHVEVAAETTGRVISAPRRKGSRVVKGDVLCRLDTGVRQAELAEAEAAVAEAEADAIAAQQLSSKGFAADTTLKTREASLRAALARLDRVRWDIEQLEIKAPFAGLLETDTAELGAFLSPGAPCATVIDLSVVKVSGYVSEAEIDLLSAGQHARARLVNGQEIDGKITFLSRMADTDTRTFAIEVTLENADGTLRDGMTAELEIDLPDQDGHLIPQSALTLNDEGEIGVRVDADGTARFLPVHLMKEEEAGVWVAGLPDVARVIIVGQEFVRDGSTIIGTKAERL